MKRGNVLVVVMIMMAIVIVILLLIAALMMGHVNSILYNIKLEMYSLNKAAILSVNKNEASIDQFSYHVKTYRTSFENALKKSFELNEELENEDHLIQKMKIKEYQILEKGKKDPFSKEILDNRVIHTVVEVKMRPIIMREIFERIFTFTIHEDVNLNFVKI